MNHIACPSDFTIVNAAAIKIELQAALDQGDGSTIDLSECKKIDSAGVQLLLAFSRAAQQSNQPIEWKDSEDGILATNARLLGLSTEFEPSNGGEG